MEDHQSLPPCLRTVESTIIVTLWNAGSRGQGDQLTALSCSTRDGLLQTSVLPARARLGTPLEASNVVSGRK